MRNYFAALGLYRTTDLNKIADAASRMSEEAFEQEGDLEPVLESELRRMHYTRAHLQYEAIAAFYSHPNANNAMDSHKWRQRTVEFDLDEMESF